MSASFERAFISDRAGISVADFLADELPLSKSKIKEAMNKGAVWRKREGEEPVRVRKAKETVRLNDEIHIYYDPSFLQLKLPALQCLEDKQQYSIWSKPQGIMAEDSLYGDHLTLARMIETQLPHDRDCYWISPAEPDIAGLMLVVHTRNLAARFEETGDKLEKSFTVSLKGNAEAEFAALQMQNSSIIHVAYNGYSDATQLQLNHIDESSLFKMLEEYGYSTADDNCLVSCNQLAFTCPLSDKQVVYRA